MTVAVWIRASSLVFLVVSVTFFGLDANRLVDHGRHGRHPAVVEVDGAIALNLSNANARALLDVVGFTMGNDLSGSVPLANARRAVIRARVILNRGAERFTRQTEVVPSRPRRREDGAVELHLAPRAIVLGLDADGLHDRLDRFERLLVVLAEKGATHLAWA